jgi:hypothetical protein
MVQGLDAPQRRSRRRPWPAAVPALLLASLGALLGAGQAAAAPVPVTVSITSITQNGTDVDPGITQGPVGDFYAGVTIGGVRQHNFADRLDYGFEFGTGFIFPWEITLDPPWTFTGTVDDSTPTTDIAIELWDNDDCDSAFCTDPGVFQNADDQVDISPAASETLNLTINLADAKWSGDAAWPVGCVHGSGGEDVEICFEVNTVSAAGDADGDALLDAWEQHGLNPDGDSAVEVDLPGFGANPRRMDVFVELDCLVDDVNGNDSLAELVDHSHCLRQDALADVVRSFANAPVANIDGSRGIQLHVDTGTLFGAGLLQVAGGVTGNVGDMGGGGSQIPEAGNTIINFDGAGATDFDTLKAANFDAPNRAQIFRYGISGHQTNLRAAVNDCTSGQAEDIKGNDFYVTLGGRRDLDGNGTGDTTCWGSTPADSIDNDGDGAVDEDPGDGVDNDGDCVAGTDTNGDGLTCTFADLRVDEDGGHSIGGRGEQGGTFMHELGHVLGLQHGGGDGTNNKPNYLSVMNYLFQDCRVRVSPAGATTPIPGGCDYSRVVLSLTEPSLDECVGLGPGLGFGRQNWNQNAVIEGITNCVPPNNANVSADVNTDGATTTLAGFEDWNSIFYAFQGLANFGSDGSRNPVSDEPDPRTIEVARSRLSALMAPAVTVGVTGPATALPGQTLTYAIRTDNHGFGPALDVGLTATRPNASTASFDLGDLLVGGEATRSVQYGVPADACPQTLTMAARADFEDFATVARSASGSVATQVLDVTPPQISVTLSPASLRPPNHRLVPITATITALDECDPNPAVRLVSVTSNEPDNGLGDGDQPGDIVGTLTGTDDRAFALRSERSGLGAGRVYTVVYSATDASANTAQATATVRVPH